MRSGETLSPNDLERYYYYIQNGTDESMIAPLPDEEFRQFGRLLPPMAKTNETTPKAIARWNAFVSQLHDEIRVDYSFSMRKAIVDYVLMNADEKRRLRIERTPEKFHLK